MPTVQDLLDGLSNVPFIERGFEGDNKGKRAKFVMGISEAKNKLEANIAAVDPLLLNKEVPPEALNEVKHAFLGSMTLFEKGEHLERQAEILSNRIRKSLGLPSFDVENEETPTEEIEIFEPHLVDQSSKDANSADERKNPDIDPNNDPEKRRKGIHLVR
ncbi:MAG: hypothetical protein WC752_00780 [Patescibacteria group bacterium]|jgi:hypothetical protein